MTDERTGQLSDAADVEALQHLTRPLLSRVCLRATLGYGRELRLHLGEPVPYAAPALAGQVRGAWILGSRGSSWEVGHLRERLSETADDDETRQFLQRALGGARVVACSIAFPTIALKMEFDNGAELLLFPDETNDAELAHWELFTPDRMVLTLGPGTGWSYRRADRSDSADASSE